jgi:SAM-dependent methyltransferase
MKRLQKINKNTPTSYIQKEPDWFDLKRLKKLLAVFKGGSLLDLGSFNSPLKYMATMKSCLVDVKSYDWVPESLPEEDGKYDYVVMGQLLEHLEEPERYVRDAIRVLRVGGILAISVPLEETEAGEVDGEGHHLWSFSKQDIEIILKPYGNYVTETIGSDHLYGYRYHFPHIIGFVKKQ